MNSTWLSSYLTLHERVLQRRPPLLQRAAQLVPLVVHVLQLGLKLPGLVRVRLDELGAAQVDGQDDGLALVVRLLQLLGTKSQTKEETFLLEQLIDY